MAASCLHLSTDEHAQLDALSASLIDTAVVMGL
jgi:hypothetical protein